MTETSGNCDYDNMPMFATTVATVFLFVVSEVMPFIKNVKSNGVIEALALSILNKTKKKHEIIFENVEEDENENEEEEV